MSRFSYLGQSWSGSRTADLPPVPPVDPPPKTRIVPTILGIETNAEPFKASFMIPTYGDEAEKVRAIRVYVVPAEDSKPDTADGWLSLKPGPRVAYTDMDVTGVFGAVSLTIPNLFGGAIFLQSIIEAGDD